MGSNLAKKITVADNAASIYDYMGQQCPNSMFINPVNEDEVVNIIKSCKPKHSNDCDDINMYVLSKVTDQIVKPLVHIFNLSFLSGICPSELKTAKVIKLFHCLKVEIDQTFLIIDQCTSITIFQGTRTII